MSEVAWLAFTLALTTTWALPGPSVWASRPVTAAAVVASYCWSADCCEVGSPPELPLPAAGHSSAPVESVIVTFWSDRPWTLEATSSAMPLTELGSTLPASDNSTEALELWLLSPNSSSCWLGSTRFTVAESMPWICSIVWSS